MPEYEKPTATQTEEPTSSKFQTFADKSVKTDLKRRTAGIAFKQPRMQQIKVIEDMLALKKKPALAGRFNIPFDGVIMRGFVNSVMAKIDDAPALRFKNTKEAALKSARKISAAAEYEFSSARTNYAQVDRWTKRLAIISGRGIAEVYGESDPEFRFCVHPVDHYDFITEPNGGSNIEEHLFDFQDNLFKSRSEMVAGAKSGYYNTAQVQKLINLVQPKDTKEAEDEYKNKVSRFQTLGLDVESNNYVGQQLFNLTKGVSKHTFGGKTEFYYTIFDPKTGIWVRMVPLKEAFESGLKPWVSFTPDDEAFNFWELGPCDVIVPIAEARRINLNAMLNNARKIADDMTIYDMRTIKDPSKLIYRPDGLVGAMLEQGKSIQDIFAKIRPNDITSISVQIEKFMNDFQGQQSGITPGAEGSATEDLATLYEGNIQQVADRIGLVNKSYALMQEQIGRRFDWALFEHAPESYMVKSIGPHGAEWEELTKEDKDPDFEVVAVSSRAEQQQSDLKAKKQETALATIISNPTLLAQVSPKKAVEETLRFGGYDEEAIKVWLDTANEGDAEVLSEAARLIEQTLEDKPIKLYRGATTGFIQKIVDYAQNTRLEDDDYFKLMELADRHLPVAQANMARKIALAQSAMPAAAPNRPVQPVQGDQPVQPAQ